MEEKKKSLLEATEEYLIEKLKEGKITAQEVAIIPQIIEATKKQR